VQVSGETVFHDGSIPLPLHGVPVRRVALDWADVSPEAVAKAAARALSGVPADGPCALAFGGPPAFGYRAARALAASLGASLGRLRPRGQHVLAFEQNVGRTVGESLVRAAPGLAVMCVDELELGDLDYLDVGLPSEAGVLPIVVKSLVFA
jgi:ethanolamine utilization protein EutA